MDLNLVDQIRSTFRALPDCRKQGNNQKYAVEDAALSAFSVFFTQSPSFLDYQRRMQKHHNRNNAQSVFGVHQIPSTSQIGNLLDPIAPETLYPMLAGVGDKLYAQGCLEPFISIGGMLLVALTAPIHSVRKGFLSLLRPENAEKRQNIVPPHSGHAGHHRARAKPRGAFTA